LDVVKKARYSVGGRKKQAEVSTNDLGVIIAIIAWPIPAKTRSSPCFVMLFLRNRRGLNLNAVKLCEGDQIHNRRRMS
jgi:hypothetical protein